MIGRGCLLEFSPIHRNSFRFTSVRVRMAGFVIARGLFVRLNDNMQQGIVYLLGAGPGDPGLITVRGRELVETAEVLVYDALSSAEMLNWAPVFCERIFVGKRASRHALPQEEINALLVKLARHGKKVADQSTPTYGAEPQLDVNWYQNDVGPFDTRIYAQAVHFVNTDSDMPEATRVHLEPTINLPWSNDWASLNTEAKLMATHYQQKNLDNYNSTNSAHLEESVNRTLPQFKMDSKLIFERDMALLADGYTQTLEPRMQYLYVPYRDQSNIQNYDSSLLQSDYSGLFRDRTYGGLDRIASANQLTTGVTTRVYDDAAVERFNVSVGQIYYFTESRTGDDNIQWEKDNKTGSIVWAGDTYWRMTDRWGLRGGVQYDTRLDNVANSSAAIEYRRDEDRMIQVSYRYASPEYIQATLPKSNDQNSINYWKSPQYSDGISQVGAAASWPIADRWSIVGAYYFDTNTNNAADQMLGLQYNSCCYALRVGYERKLNGWENNQSKYDNVIGFNFELRGLSSNYGLGTQKMLRSNILPYRSSL